MVQTIFSLPKEIILLWKTDQMKLHSLLWIERESRHFATNLLSHARFGENAWFSNFLL